jgi:hypothetical protein
MHSRFARSARLVGSKSPAFSELTPFVAVNRYASRSDALRLGHGEGDRLQTRALGGVDEFIDDQDLPIERNWVENQIEPGPPRWSVREALRGPTRSSRGRNDT